MRRLARHTFTAAAGLSLVLLVACAWLWWKRHDHVIHRCGNVRVWANEAEMYVDYYRPLRPDEPDEQWERHAFGVSNGAATYLGEENLRRRYVSMPHVLAFPALSTLPAAWVIARLVRRRKAPGRGFDVQPGGCAGDGRSNDRAKHLDPLKPVQTGFICRRG